MLDIALQGDDPVSGIRHVSHGRLQHPAAAPRSKWISMRRVSAGVAPCTDIRLSVITPQGLSTGPVGWQAEAASAVPSASAILNRAARIIGALPCLVVGELDCGTGGLAASLETVPAIEADAKRERSHGPGLPRHVPQRRERRRHARTARSSASARAAARRWARKR
ncbi:hypothetical protein J2Y55_005834 [Bosea sp. BE125]|nr:hypothetical protein [Bosea sp. BE125]